MPVSPRHRYLVDRRIDMLPPVLSTNICSLRCDYDRLACSVFLSFDKSRFGLRVSPVGTLNVVKPPVFARTVLRSRYSLAYPQAQALADHKIPPIIDNPYKNSDSPYKYTGSEVREEDYEWLRHDVSILMRSAEGRFVEV